MTEPSSSDRLSFTVFLALALHALVIFGITFTLSKSDKVAPTLNITLATHASAKAPEKADFLAQHNQEASGTESEVKELTTTEQAKVSDTSINQINPLPVPAQQRQSAKDTAHITTQSDAKRSVSTAKKLTQERQAEQAEQTNTKPTARSEKLASLQAKLDQQRQSMAREPRITRHTSVSAKSSDEAAYYNGWSAKIVRVGNKNFPKEAIEKEIYGSLRLEVGVRANGSVDSVTVTSSSGHAILDDAARRIVRLAAPFDPLPPEITKNTDIFVIYRTWNFEITGLTTSD